MYLKNYRQCPYPAERASHSKEMELIYQRCLQSEPKAHEQSLHSQSLPRVHDKRQQAKHIPQHKPSSDESAKEQGSKVHQKSVRHSKQNERKDSSSGYNPVKTGRSKVHQRENKEHTIHDDKKLTSPEIPVKSGNESLHKSQESITVFPLPPWKSEQGTSKLLVPNAAPKDSSSLPSSSKKIRKPVSNTVEEEKSEVRVKKTPSQTVEKNAQGTSSTAQIPVRITPRIDGIGRTSGSFTVLRTDPSREPPVIKTKLIESRSSEPPVKRKKSLQKMISIIPGKMIQGSTGADMQTLDRRGEEAAFRLTPTDDEISDDDIFREIPEQYSYVATEAKEKTIVTFKGEQLQLNGAASRDNKKYSHRNFENIKEAGHQPSKDVKSHSVPSTGRNVSKAGKDILAREPSRSNTISEKDRPRKETHKDPRSELILTKRDKLMKTYRLDCELFAMVAKQLVNQDPTIEKPVQSALRKSLRQIGEQCLEELKKSIAKYDAANAVKNSN